MMLAVWAWWGVPPGCGGVPLESRGSCGGRRGGQDWVVGGGPQTWSNSAVQWCRQGQPSGRWRVIRRADDAIRAAMLMSLRRIVGVVALARSVPARVAAARVRLNAMTAS